MSHESVARRYARALLDVTLKEGGDPTRIESELARFVALVTGHDALRKVFENPAIPVSKKRAIVGALVGPGEIDAVLRKWLLLLADRDRLSLLTMLLAVYRERLMEHQNIVRAEVTTAVELSDARVSALRRGLETLTGKEVAVRTQVDPSIIGGVVTRIGSTIYDGSIKRRLELLREQIVGS